MKRLLDTIKSWLSKTSHEDITENPPAPDAPALKEDDSELVGEILWEVLLEQGVRPSEIRNAQIKELFDAWYDGPCTKKSIAASVGDFKKAHSISFGCDYGCD